MPVKTRSDLAETWRCDACGADNDEPLQTCSECSAARLAVPSLSPGNKPKRKALKSKKARSKGSKIKEPKNKESKPETVENRDLGESLDKARPITPAALGPLLSEELLPEPPIEVESGPESEEENNFHESEPIPEIRGTRLEKPEVTPQYSFSQPSSSPTGQGQYSLVFVNTPAQSLAKSKVQLDFDSFSTISIGRSSENVVVIPDQEVSRTHAQLTRDGEKIVLKDLQSKNGTYLYNGKEFQQINDSVELKPNSMVKFGTGTIVKFTCE